MIVQKKITVNRFIVLMVVFFLSWVSSMKAQTFKINSLTIDTDFSLGTNNFEAGKLTVEANVPNGTSQVTITLPDGVTYKNNSLTFDTSISGIAGNPTASSVSASSNQLTFNLGVTSAGAVKFSIVKKMSPQAHLAVRAGQQLKDKVKIQQGTISDEKISSDHYFYKYPIMNLQQMYANITVVKNTEYTGNFVILNGGTATAEDVYFTIDYPEGISGGEVRLNSATGTILTPYRTEGNKKFFKIAKTQFAGASGLLASTSVTVFDKYTVTVNCLDKNITYTANWGESGQSDDWYQADDTANKKVRRVATPEGTPTIELTRKNSNTPNPDGNANNIDFTKTYFTLDKGICAAVGESVGRMRLSFTNYGSNTSLGAAMYSIAVYLEQGNYPAFVALYKPTNIKVGTKNLTVTSVTIPSVKADRVHKIDFSSLNADPDGVGGLDDLDGDGVFDDLPSMATFVLEYDLVKLIDTSDKCALGDFYGFLHYRYHPKIAYETLCGDKIGGQGTDPLQRTVNLRDWVFEKGFYPNGDGSFLVSNLIEGDPKQIYLATGQSGSNYYSREFNHTGNNVAKWRMQYKITLPANVSASNFKWYASDGYQVLPLSSAHTVTPVIAGNEYTILAPLDNTKGYVTMDLQANCGTSSDGTIQYEIQHLEHYGTPRQCLVKMLCKSTPIRVVCPSNCGNDGPTIEKIYAERAENSLGWTDHTMQIRHTKTTLRTVAPELLEYALEHDEVEIIAQGKQEQGTADNLHFRFIAGKAVSLMPKSAVVKFTSGTRSGTQQTIAVSSSTVNETVTGTVLNRQSTFNWNLTQALGGQPLQQGDTFEVITTYQVTRYTDYKRPDLDFNTYTAQRVVGAGAHFYMIRAGAELFCGPLRVPEKMKIILLDHLDGTNANQKTEGCKPKDIDGNLLHMAKRHSSSNITLTNEEFRPDRLIKSFKFTLPKTYSVTGQVIYYYRKSPTNPQYESKTFNYSDFIKTETNDFVTYEIHNTYDPATKTYKLPPGLVGKHNQYSAWINVKGN